MFDLDQRRPGAAGCLMQPWTVVAVSQYPKDLAIEMLVVGTHRKG